ncbi:MAG TPA: bifunctional demethylmenaquinone methyltransferase/2-methoxy-6-polyprenyl-1,4-benzoquinol methylase UbiE [Blastocatellia bacterium]|nr:bifunctional demethylmenaquinone methyltransferase/2-methoxy-6-polyprenyl-1,4-benzoquinol methylase UbiE [Blastocatellia bacterium]
MPELSKATRVRSMFAEIAPRYDVLNHLLSLSVDRWWRRYAVKKVRAYLSRPGAVALDLCCGTADLALDLAEVAPAYGVDFCHPMLRIGLKKVQAAGRPVEIIEADALQVPFANQSFDVVTVAFGLRNLEDAASGLSEMLRLLKPGGCAAVLEFSRPRIPVFRSVFQFYFTRLLPLIGNAVSGSSYAYRYLPESVKTFPNQESLAALMRRVGFSNVRYYNLFFGAAALHTGERPDTPPQIEPKSQG